MTSPRPPRPDPSARIQAVFAFAAELQPLLPSPLRGREILLCFHAGQTCKHLIESLGVPHTEVSGVTINGRPADLSCQPSCDDRIAVLPAVTPSADSPEPGFVLDAHLGRLCAALRMLGLDCLYRDDYDDEQLVSIQKDEGRILLSRDRRLLMRRAVTRGALIRSLDPDEQLAEVFRRFDLGRWVRPFRRCLRCNTPLQPVDKAEILPRLQPLTRLYYDEFRICPACDQIYWRGSHFERMTARIEALRGSAMQNSEPGQR